jgi:hypothetical protein
VRSIGREMLKVTVSVSESIVMLYGFMQMLCMPSSRSDNFTVTSHTLHCTVLCVPGGEVSCALYDQLMGSARWGRHYDLRERREGRKEG